MRNTDAAASRPTCSPTADCEFELANLATAPDREPVADDPAIECDESCCS